MDKNRKKRSEINFKYKWDLSSLYENDNEWQEDLKKYDLMLETIPQYQGKIMESSNSLLHVLSKCEETMRLGANLYVYANMRYHENTKDNESIKNKGKIEKLFTKTNEKMFYIEIEILKSDYQLIEKYMNELDSLQPYKFYFEKLFRGKKHKLTDPEEKILASLGEILDSSDDVFTTINNADIKYGTILINDEKIELTDGNFVKLLQDENQTTRKKVFKRFYKIRGELKNTFATTLKHNIKSSFFISKVRKYDNPLQMNLFYDDIDLKVYNNLINTVNKNLDVLHKYIKLRKRELGLKQLHMYDIYAKMVSGNKEEYTYEKAFETVKKALAPLGEDYISLLEKAYTERWIDVFDNEGKKNGAYSWGTYESNPYILLQFNNNLDSVSTLAHELGHSMHSYYTNKKQPYIYHGYSIFTAEIASTVNEILLNQYLLGKTDDVKEKKILLNELMEKFKGTLYRQTMFAEFEKIIFEKEENNEVLTEQAFSDIYYNLNKKYYGDDIIHDDDIKLEWTRIPHFYRPFYVYQYATGISASCAIAIEILNGNEEMLKKYKTFLSNGNSNYPIALLKELGIDMTTTEPIEKAIKLFEKTIDQYAELN